MAAPVYDNGAVSAVVSAQVSTLPISWTQNIAAGASAIVAVNNGNNGTNNGFTPTGTPTCTVGGQSLTFLGYQTQGTTTNLGFIAVWAGLNVPSGSSVSIVTSIASAGNTQGNAYGVSHTYTGVGSFGALQSGGFASGTDTLSANSATGHTLWGMIGEWWNDGFNTFSLTSRQTNGLVPAFLCGDTAGASSVSVSAVAINSRESAIVAVDMLPVGAPTNQFFAMF